MSGPKGEVTVQELTPAERTVARRAAEARATVPDLEMSVALGPGQRPNTPALIQACARALREHPRANASYRDGHFELHSRVNVGVILTTVELYLVPTIFDADQKEAADIAQELDDLEAQAGQGRIPASTFSGATFTLWNAAADGISRASIPVVPPQSAALAAGTESLTLVCDHRILYGAQAAGFLRSVQQQLE
jgi:pyruvate dehydrogenase E2 component (dihydrolipoamide acetyltransferase)